MRRVHRVRTLVYRDGKLQQACLTVSGARYLTWKLRRQERRR